MIKQVSTYWSVLLFSTIGLFCLPLNVRAQETRLELDSTPMTSVSQLSDVKPTDWSFQALQSLVERYGCISGYPDKTFRGNRSMTRYEFAVGLSRCLDRITEMIGKSDLGASREDIATVKKLQSEYSSELAVLKGRVETLEGRTETLEKQQFSSTVKLNGVATITLQGRSGSAVDLFPVDGTPDTQDPGTQINMMSSVYLGLTGQLSNRMRFLVGLQAGRGSSAPSLSSDVALATESDTGGQVRLADLSLQYLVSPNFAITVGGEGVSPTSIFRGPNRYANAATGPLSRFAQNNPILNSPGGSGFGFDWQIAPRVSLQGIYAASNAGSPTSGNGLFNGGYVAGLNATIAPTRNLDLSLTYLHTHSPTGTLGLGSGENQITPGGEPINTHLLGAGVNARISPKLVLGGWGGWTTSRIPEQSGSAETLNWMVYANLPDLFGKGNLGGLYVGQPPRITNSTFTRGGNVPDLLAGGVGEPGGQTRSTTHVEAFWRWQINDNLSITPGAIAIFNQGNAGSQPTYIGVLRTAFLF